MKKQQSALIVTLTLVTCGLTSVILISGGVNPLLDSL